MRTLEKNQKGKKYYRYLNTTFPLLLNYRCAKKKKLTGGSHCTTPLLQPRPTTFFIPRLFASLNNSVIVIFPTSDLAES